MSYLVGTPEDRLSRNMAHILQVKDGVEDLIRQHQVVPGSIIRSLLERFTFKDKIS